MTLEQQVVSLELAQKLKELGVKQGSLFTWIFDLHHNYWRIADAMGDIMKNDRWKWCAAFTVAELGEMLPSSFEYQVSEHGTRPVNFTSGRTVIENGWYVMYSDPHPANKVPVYAQHALTEANARAQMLIYLIENNLLPEKTKEL